MSDLSVPQRAPGKSKAISRTAATDPTCAMAFDMSKDRCLALISHELKQPLTAILMSVDRLLDMADGGAAPRIAQDLHLIRNATRRQARIVNDLLEISRIRNGKIRLDRAREDVGQIVQYMSATLAESVPDRRFVVDVEDDPCWCIVDPVRLEQIVSNLLDNAIKFSGSGGSIHIRVKAVGDFAGITVADDGIGISTEFLPHVFTMFDQGVRLPPAAKNGLGIGLALVKDLVAAHGGKVTAHSAGPGRGASFTVWIPLA